MEDKLASQQDSKERDAKMEFRFSQLESKLTIKMGTMLAASIAILTAIQKFS